MLKYFFSGSIKHQLYSNIRMLNNI